MQGVLVEARILRFPAPDRADDFAAVDGTAQRGSVCANISDVRAVAFSATFCASRRRVSRLHARGRQAWRSSCARRSSPPSECSAGWSLRD